MKKSAAVLSVFATLAFLSVSASADVIQFQSTGGQSVNGVEIYPYNLSVNGGSAIAMMCLNFNLEITGGETWHVAPTAIPLDGSQLAIDYRADALIFSGIQTNAFGISTSDYQFAAWSIFDPAIIGTNSGFTPTAATVRAAALAYAVHAASFDYSKFTLFIPTSDMSGWTNGQPQTFIDDTASLTPTPNLGMVPTPEPSSLMLLGTGVLGIASIARRKLAKV